ncbi:DUF397 domain-containing protein [Streptomyces geranii]|uniref:DUF397 domain-containing protein n=1 Tax=Streptomyces geranii TaxID=2058923 RepID=UPI000D024058|nr:DUF397 domain-containing protein [Streptomyces geranii]
MTPHWQKSSYCSEGASCVHISTTPDGVHLTESSDPTGAVLTTTPTAFRTLLTTLKTSTPPPKTTPPGIEVTLGETPDAPVHLRSTTTPGTVVTTDHHKWHAFVLGVRAGEFDHFAEVAGNL